MLTEKRVNNKFLIIFFFCLLFIQISYPTYAETIKLGWQTPWATQGQLVMGLKHTNIPALTGVDIEYIGFTYGGPLNQAALAGKVDILLTADQPAIALLARDRGYKIVARMMYNRTCLYVPVASPIKKLAQLKGKSVAGPVGAAAERISLQALRDSGVDLNTIQFGNIDMARQTALITAGSKNGKWGPFDALYGFDPLPAVFENKNVAKMIHCGSVVSVVVANTNMLTKRRQDLEAFLSAFLLSWYQFATKTGEMNRIFLSESKLDFSERALEIAASIEPNMKATALRELRLLFSPDDMNVFNFASDFLLSKGIIKNKINIEEPRYLDINPLKSIISNSSLNYKAKNIKILKY